MAAVAAAAVAVAAIWHCRTGNSRTEVFIAVEDSVIVRLTIHQGPTHPQTYIAVSGAAVSLSGRQEPILFPVTG